MEAVGRTELGNFRGTLCQDEVYSLPGCFGAWLFGRGKRSHAYLAVEVKGSLNFIRRV